MKLVVLVLMVAFALGFIILGSIFKEEKRGGYAMLSAFVIILLAGILTASFGIEYQSGSSIVDSGSTINVTFEFASLDTMERAVVAVPLMLAGLWGTIVMASAMRAYTRSGEADE